MTKKETIEQQAETLIMPVVEALGFELVDMEYIKEAGAYYLRAYIDKPGGITIDDCETVSRSFSDLLDEKDFIEDSYILEVSSPGLGRPLKKEKDFQRETGKEIEVRLFAPVDGKKEYTGILTAYENGLITIMTEDGRSLSFKRTETALVRLALDF